MSVGPDGRRGDETRESLTRTAFALVPLRGHPATGHQTNQKIAASGSLAAGFLI